jgi:RimJ/RimL family protein N-acetyltransferase
MRARAGPKRARSTSRVVLLPASPQHILALIDGESRFAEVAGLAAAPGLRDFFASGEVSAEWLESLRAGGSADPWQYGFFVLERGADVAIGTAGFKGPPDGSGLVEIGYAIVAGRQGRGYATQPAEALVAFASRDGRVRAIRAHTLPERSASTRVLGKCGFSFAGDVVDPQDGAVWRWERPAASS